MAFGVHSLVFPPDPRVHVGRAANAAFSGLDGVDWPISCDALEPWYGRAEDELAVSGIYAPELGAPRSSPYPMPPVPQSYLDRRVEESAQGAMLRLGAGRSWQPGATREPDCTAVPRRG